MLEDHGPFKKSPIEMNEENCVRLAVIYLADAEAWAYTLLIRTGSKQHNVRLCMIGDTGMLKYEDAEKGAIASPVIPLTIPAEEGEG